MARTVKTSARPTFFATPTAFRSWLETHHASAGEVVVGYYKRHTGKPSLTWPESVDEALCFGWIDGIRRSLGPDSYTIRFTPRKPSSLWSRVNVDNVERLKKEGRMRPAGLRAYAARTPERTGLYSFERHEAARLTDDERKTFDANKKAAAFFDAQPPSYRGMFLHWVTSAKRPETRARRLADLIKNCAAGRRIDAFRTKKSEAPRPLPRGGRS